MLARSRSALSFALALGLVAVAQPARAQDLASLPSSVTAPSLVPTAAPVLPAADVASATGPTVDAATVGVRHHDDAAMAPAPRRGGSGPGVALMIVGGAAILVGLLINNNAGGAIAVGGAVVGLVGLYQYLQ